MKAPMLNIHAEEQRIYLESLSPNTKTRIQENDAAAHQKRRESLSPDMKACIQENDAVAHQKRRQSLSR